MKRIFVYLSLLMLVVTGRGYAVESVLQSAAEQVSPTTWEITFIITTATNGSVTAEALDLANRARVRGMHLIQVDAFATVGGTPPDAADVIMYDENGIYYLGSEDDGATAYAGLNLIHATIPKSCVPNMYLTGQDSHINYYWPMRGVITWDIINQATDTAHITLVLVFYDTTK